MPLLGKIRISADTATRGARKGVDRLGILQLLARARAPRAGEAAVIPSPACMAAAGRAGTNPRTGRGTSRPAPKPDVPRS
jgi:hypothetical protein